MSNFRKNKQAQKLAKEVWGKEYRRLLVNNEFGIIDKYSEADFVLIQENIQLKPGMSFLEIGCGRGRVSAMLAKFGVNVTGLDISSEAITLAKKIFKKNNLKGSFVCGDVESLPFSSNKFNLVFGGGVLEHVENTQKAFGEVFRVLRRKGKLITTMPCLSLTTITQGLLTGSIPQIPILKNLYLFIHRDLLKEKLMIYGYEKIYSIKKIVAMVEKAGFKKVFTQPYKVKYDFKFIPTRALKKIAFKLVQKKGFWPMIGLVAEK